MILSFSTKKIRELCEREDLARGELGQLAAGMLKQRLGDLDAAPSWADLPDEADYVPNSNGTLRTADLGTHMLRLRAVSVDTSGVDTTEAWANVRRIQIIDVAKR